MLSLYRHGDKVTIGPGIEGTVVGLSLYGNDYSRVLYLVSWWDDRTHKEEWFDCSMVEAADETVARLTLVEGKAGGNDHKGA